ncbi:MAG TPA: HAMP domain-containing sensor histidine kinase [Bacillota bacterium]|nr:HAMP domain-containing histidine kinase [Bacillota bacterium]HOB86299.1 HAMP domain-containing sensor histidine kinase [Bacillota bacterium]HOP69620.1 HAMP domain-containing sensor histidine kinase [Bacillota bacterium]HPT34697.1 HAMP domain-containing sensor histidine kinase [Bacillota bacterium]HPZ65358.1 HAMP domain-containing sensor histidine kinase [Bacillota bacterium]
MKIKFFSGLRWKMIKYFLLSIFYAAAIVGGAVLLAVMLYPLDLPVLGDLLRFVVDLLSVYEPMGFFVVIFLATAILFLLFFFLMTREIISGFEQIGNSLEAIAAGNLEHRVPPLGRDELGQLAENVNRMAERLHQSITRERLARQAKDELVTSVSHDLRTPLTSILGYLDLIESDRYRDEVELRHYTQIVYSKALRLQKMIEDLFEYTRLSSGGIQLNLHLLDLGELLEQLVVEMQPLLEQAGVDCRTFPPAGRVLVRGDGDQLVRVFENLLANAARYGREGKYMDLAWREEGDRAVVEVINYGPPIPAGELPHIFERFYRVEKSRAEFSGGTGLGLAIAKNIVELHGGRIAAFSDPRRTLFEVRLPLHEDKEAIRWSGPPV